MKRNKLWFFGAIVILLISLVQANNLVVTSAFDEPLTSGMRAGLTLMQSQALAKLYVDSSLGQTFSYDETQILRRFALGQDISTVEADLVISRALYTHYILKAALTSEQQQLLQAYEDSRGPIVQEYDMRTMPMQQAIAQAQMEVEPNNSILQANENSANLFYGQLKANSADIDTFAFSAGQGSVIALSFGAAHNDNEGQFAAKLELLDSNGKHITPQFISKNVPNSANRVAVFNIPIKGDYYAKVSAAKSSLGLNFDYLLSIDTLKPNNASSSVKLGEIAPLAATFINGDFETGDFTGFTKVDQPGSIGSWFVYTGARSPLTGFSLPPPPQGRYAAVTDDKGRGSHIIYQDITLGSGPSTLSFTLYYNNLAGGFATPNTLDYTGSVNQQYRVDIIDPTLPANTLTTLANVFITRPGAPSILAPTNITFDLTPFANSTIRVRFAEVANKGVFLASVDNLRVMTSTTTTLTSAPNPSVFGQPVVLTATVTANPPSSGTPTGTVTFLDNGVSLGTGTLSGGIATFTTTSLSTGTHSLTATYGSDANFNGSTSAPAISQVVNQAATSTTLASSVNPSVSGQSITFTATVTAVAPGAGIPTGMIQFLDNGVSIGTGTINSSGIATFTTSALSVGTHPITATYGGDTNFTSSTSNSISQVVNQDSTTTSLVSNANPSVFGQSVTFTATVAANSPGSGTPTGTVTFFDNGVQIGVGTLTNGSTTFTTSTLSVGTHPITATYSGDTNFTGSTSTPALQQVVNTANTTTSVVSNANPSVFGQSVTFTATVTVNSPGSGSPTGSINFFDNGVLLGNVPLSGASATFTTTTLSVGTHPITAMYSGDTNFNSSTSTPALQQVVNQAATTTSLVSSLNPSTFGQSVTFTATVTVNPPGAGTPTGMVHFLDNGVQIGTGALSGGVATFSTTALTAGTHPITATYGGDTNFTTSTSNTVSQVVNQAATTTSLASSVNPSVFGQSVTFTATVTAVAPGAGTPTGTVHFFDNGVQIGTGTLSGGVATFSTSALIAGTHPITATYGGDTNFTSSTSNTVSQVVNQDSTTTTLVSSANPSVFGQSVTFTATVTANPPGAGTPTGMVTFLDNGASIGTGALNGSGMATFTTSTLSVGAHPITATYGGDTNFITSTSNTVSQVVNQDSTTTALVSSANPSVFGQSVTFTATVTANPPGAGTPTGMVTFLDNGVSIGTGALNGSGMATFTTSTLSVGMHPITAMYGGDTNFTSSTSTPALQQVVNMANTTTMVVSNANPSVFGQMITFTATVTVNAPGTGTPTGMVTFLDNGVSIGTGALNGSGMATFTISTLSVGMHPITAMYGGDTNFNSSTSTPALQQVVNQAATTTSLVSSLNPSTFGQMVTFTATVTVNPPGAGTPTGTVHFLDNGVQIGMGALNGSGMATFSTSALTAGMHPITATYGGDTSFATSTSSPALQQVVNQAATTTALVSNVNPSVFGQSVTFMATVAAVAPGAGTPTGTVHFFDNGVQIGMSALSGGVATFTTSALSVGMHPITATYGGDNNFTSSTSNTVTQMVNQDTTTTSLVSNVNPSVFGQSVTFTATVTANAPGSGIPTGMVMFLDNGVLIGTSALSGGVATFSTAALSVATHPITAVYSGDTNFITSTSNTLSQVVNMANTTTTLTSSANPAQTNQPITFTATVTAVAPGAGIPTGTVTFFDGGTQIGMGMLNGSGVATFTTSILTPGSHSITAVYGGDTNFNGSTSNILTQGVGGADHNSIYVADTFNNRIQRSINDGATWQLIGNGAGTGLGQFNQPQAVTANFADTIIFVADTGNNRVQRSTDGGNSWQLIAAPGTAVNQVSGPQGIAYDEFADILYIADTNSNRILKVMSASTVSPSFSVMAGPGTAPGQVNQPQGLATDGQGFVYIADTNNNRIQLFNGSWSILASAGTLVGTVNRPTAVYVNNSGIIFIADTGNNRIQTLNGRRTASVFIDAGKAVGTVNAPQGVTFAISGNVFIGDTGNSRIEKKNFVSGVTTIVGPAGTTVGRFNQPTGVR